MPLKCCNIVGFVTAHRLLQISVGPYSKAQQLVQIVDKGADNSVSGGWICGVQGGGFSRVRCFLQADESASLLFLFGSSLALVRSRRRGARRQHRRVHLLVLSRTPPAARSPVQVSA